MDCFVCAAQPVEAGLLCEDCREPIAGPYWLVPEQIVDSHVRPSGAVLIDMWGRPHALDLTSVIGRGLVRAGVVVLDASVSRNHAELARDGAAAWTLRDLGSSSRTLIDDEPISGPVVLPPRARLTFGQVGFYFVAEPGELPVVELDPAYSATVPTTEPQPAGDVATDWEDVGTAVGMRSLRIRLAEPTGGGAGFVDVGNKRVILAGIQFELIAALVRRMREDVAQPDIVRGFIRSTELMDSLSWDTSQPSHDHLKQLVRRVRRILTRAEIGDLIEARYRFGYRLRVLPVD